MAKGRCRSRIGSGSRCRHSQGVLTMQDRFCRGATHGVSWHRHQRAPACRLLTRRILILMPVGHYSASAAGNHQGPCIAAADVPLHARLPCFSGRIHQYEALLQPRPFLLDCPCNGFVWPWELLRLHFRLGSVAGRHFHNRTFTTGAPDLSGRRIVEQALSCHVGLPL